MKNLLRFFAFVLMVGGAYAQSNLPACPSSDYSGYFHMCFGTLTIADGTKYIGEFKNGKFNGQGTYTAYDYKYVGEFKDGKGNGRGTYTFVDGRKYVGEFKDEMRNGQGTYTFANGSKYVGEWKDDRYNGQGTLFASNGSVTRQGVWANGNFIRSAPVQQASAINQSVATATQQPNISQSNLPTCPSSGYFHNCFGTTNHSNGDKYVGEFKDNKYNGQGTFYFLANNQFKGDKYVGSFKDDYRHGQGTATYSDGEKYVGAFKDDKYHGQGTRTFTNGEKYVGEFKNDEYNGQGVYYSPGGERYVGEWRDGKRNGQGTTFFSDGKKYVGGFTNNSFNGQGTLFALNGSVIYQGIWDFGLYANSAPVKQVNVPPVQLSSNERDRLNAEVEAERKKRQELEAQLAASVQPPLTQTNAPRRIAHALVIGNAAYPGSGRLDNPVNDANAISQKLRSMGFIVTTVTDANRQRLVQSMAQFRRTAASADISLLYYAGHGVQIFGTNYILPTDVDQTDPAQATIQGVSLNSVVENFLPGKTKLVFLDACRDNALQRTSDRSVSKGLAPISAAEGTLISYATKDGQTAADGVGSKNSPFTQALLEHLNDPQDIAVVLRKVRERVMKITGGKQQPWEYGSLTGGELVLSAIKPK